MDLRRAVEPGAVGELCQIAGSGEFDLGKQRICVVVAELFRRSPHGTFSRNGADHVLDVAGGNHRGSGRGREAHGLRRSFGLRNFYGGLSQKANRGQPSGLDRGLSLRPWPPGGLKASRQRAHAGGVLHALSTLDWLGAAGDRHAKLGQGNADPRHGSGGDESDLQ